MGNGRQRETRKKGYNGRQYRRQDLGKADTPSNTKADTLRKPTPTLRCLKKCKIRPPTTKGNKKKDKLGDKLGDKKEDKLGDKGDKGDKTSGRWTHHPTQRNKKGDNGRQGGDKTSGKWTHHATQWEAMKTKTSGRWTIQHRLWGDNGKQLEATGDNGRQWETRGDNRRQG